MSRKYDPYSSSEELVDYARRQVKRNLKNH